MKKDIEIPEVKGVSLLALHEEHDELKEKVWNIYLANNRSQPLDTVMVVLRGYSEDKKTSVMRRTLENLDPGCFARLEFLPDELLDFRNEYLITFFEENTMYEKNFNIDPGSLNTGNLVDIPELDARGIRFE